MTSPLVGLKILDLQADQGALSFTCLNTPLFVVCHLGNPSITVQSGPASSTWVSR